MNNKEVLLTLHYEVDGENFSLAGQASGNVKKELRQIGLNPEIIRRVAIALYEGEINMVIHADGGFIDVEVTPKHIKMILTDKGPGIENPEKAMQEGFSTATEDIRNLGFGAGMGLPNMKKYTDKLTLDSVVGVGTTLEMFVYF